MKYLLALLLAVSGWGLEVCTQWSKEFDSEGRNHPEEEAGELLSIWLKPNDYSVIAGSIVNHSKIKEDKTDICNSTAELQAKQWHWQIVTLPISEVGWIIEQFNIKGTSKRIAIELSPAELKKLRKFSKHKKNDSFFKNLFKKQKKVIEG